MAKSLDFDLASIQVAKGSLDVSQVFKHYFGFSTAPVKLFGKVRVGRIQELNVIQLVQVQDELADLLEAFLPPAFREADDFGFRLGSSLHGHSRSDAT